MRRGESRITEGLLAVNPLGRPLRQAGQALLAVGGIAHGQQVARLGIEHEQQLVEQAQTGRVDLAQALIRLLAEAQLLAAIGNEAVGDLRHHLIEDQLFELVADAFRVGGRAFAYPLHEGAAAGIRQEGVAAEEEPPAFEAGELLRCGAARPGYEEAVEDQPQIHLVEFAGGAADLPAVEAPGAAVGQDAPRAARAHQIADHLVAGVALGLPGVAARAVLLAEWPAPVLGFGDRRGAAVERVIVPLVGIGLLLGRRIAEQRVVGPRQAAAPPLRLDLDDVAPPQRVQHRLDELLLGLRLVPTATQRARPLPQNAQRLENRPRIGGPFGVLRQARLEVVLGEERLGSRQPGEAARCDRWRTGGVRHGDQLRFRQKRKSRGPNQKSRGLI